MTHNTGFYQWREQDSITGLRLPSWFPDDVRVTSEPTGLVVGVPLIKAGLPSPNMVNDELIELDIKAVTEQIEKYLNRDLLSRTRQAIYYNAGDMVFVNPVPVNEVTLVQGINRDGDAVTLTENTDYFVRGYGENLQIYGIKNHYDYLQVTYTTGYGTGAEVPSAIKKAIVQEVFRQFKRRQDPIIASDTTIDSLSSEAQALIRSYIKRRAV